MTASSGWPVLLVLVPLLPLDLVAFIAALDRGNVLLGVMFFLLIPVLVLTLVGLFIVNPNQGRVVLLFGRYVGTVKEPWSALGQPVPDQAKDLAASPQLRDRTLEGERHRRESDRDRVGRGLEGGRHG
jgi:regulator of protease activity HflC (stomatin/prohibitin superfamily)